MDIRSLQQILNLANNINIKTAEAFATSQVYFDTFENAITNIHKKINKTRQQYIEYLKDLKHPNEDEYRQMIKIHLHDKLYHKEGELLKLGKRGEDLKMIQQQCKFNKKSSITQAYI